MYRPLEGNDSGLGSLVGSESRPVIEIPIKDRLDFACSMPELRRKIWAVTAFEIMPHAEAWERFRTVLKSTSDDLDFSKCEIERINFLAEVESHLSFLGLSNELENLQEEIASVDVYDKYYVCFMNVRDQVKILILLQYVAPGVDIDFLLRIVNVTMRDYYKQLGNVSDILLEKPQIVERFKLLAKNEPAKKDPIILTLSACRFCEEVDVEVLKSFAKPIPRRVVRDNTKINLIIHIISYLNQWGVLEKEFAEQLLKHIAKHLENQKEYSFRNVAGYILLGLTLTNNVDVLNALCQHEDFSIIMEVSLASVKRQYFIDDRAFSLLSREPELILQFVEHNILLQQEHAELQREKLDRFIRHVFSGLFPSMKYYPGNAHTGELIKISPVAYRKWSQEYQLNLQEIIDLVERNPCPQKQKFDCKEYLRSALLVHQHLDEEKYAPIYNFLKDKSKVDVSTVNYYQQATLILLYQLYEALDVADNLQEVYKILSSLRREGYFLGQFGNDVAHARDEIIKILLPNDQSKTSKKELDKDEKLKFAVTGDPILLFRAGVVGGSCQRFDTKWSISLLTTFVYAPHVKLLALYREDGKKLLARCKLSLLLGDDGPVLYLERIYTDVSFPRMNEVFILAAREYAMYLGVDLVCAPELQGAGALSNDTLRCLTTVGPEYVDSAGGIVVESNYTITRGTLEYRHPKQPMALAWQTLQKGHPPGIDMLEEESPPREGSPPRPVNYF